MFNIYRRTLLLILTTAIATACFATITFASDLIERAKGEGLLVAFYNSKPYAYKNDDDVLTGTDVDTLRVVLDRMGGKIASAKATEWGALIPGIKAERFDVVAAGMFVTPKRCNEVKFSEPTFGIQQSMVIVKGNPKGISNYESLVKTNLKVGVVSGTAQTEYVRSAGVLEENIMKLPDNPTGVAALRAGRIDAWAVSAPNVRNIISSLESAPIEATPAFAEVNGKVAVSHGAFAFRKGDAAFVKAFNAELKTFIGSPEHLKILSTHGMTPDELPISTTAMLCNQ